MVNGTSSVTRTADWEHAHCNTACLLQLSFCTCPRAFDSVSAFKIFGTERQKQPRRGTVAKYRNHIAGQSIDIEWRLCFGDTSVQTVHMLQEFMSEAGRAAQSFPDRITSASMFNDITNWASQKVQNNVWLERLQWPLTQQNSDLVIGVLVVQHRRRPGKFNEERPISPVCRRCLGQARSQDDKWTHHQQAPSVQVFEHSSNKCIDEAEERRSRWNATRKGARHSSHADEYGLGVQSSLCAFAVKILDPEQFRFKPPYSN